MSIEETDAVHRAVRLRTVEKWRGRVGLLAGGALAFVGGLCLQTGSTQTVPAPVPTPAVVPPSPSPVASTTLATTNAALLLGRTSPLGQVPDWTKLEQFNGLLTKEEFENAWKETYSSGTPFPPPWEMGPDGVKIQTGQTDRPTVTIRFKKPTASGQAAGAPLAPTTGPSRYWRGLDDLPPLKGRPPLSDLHIALDPGHIGGGYAQMEERYLSFKPGEAVQEGDLTLLTAQVIKPRLEALGANVSLVRDRTEPVTEARPADMRGVALDLLREFGYPKPQDSYAGMQGDQRIVTVQWQSEKLFYRVSEIHARASKVNNQIKPDMVICLHFNAESWGDAQAPQFSPLNHLHAMVNGCYALEELRQADVRYEMFDRLFSRLHEAELPLTESIVEGVAESTGLPAYVYKTPNARHAGLGSYVYARNLLANRIYRCPVVYLEPFVMNHEETYHRLLMGHYLGRTLLNGRLQRSAIEEYAQGVVRGLESYYKRHRKP